MLTNLMLKVAPIIVVLLVIFGGLYVFAQSIM